jgi:hypothetical protein
MTFCTVTDNPAGTQDLYEQVIQRIRDTGQFRPEGTICHIAGPHESGWRVINVWESREAAERFVNDRLNPAFQHLGAEPRRR